MGIEFRIRSEKTRKRLMELVRAIAYLTGHDADDADDADDEGSASPTE